MGGPLPQEARRVPLERDEASSQLARFPSGDDRCRHVVSFFPLRSSGKVRRIAQAFPVPSQSAYSRDRSRLRHICRDRPHAGRRQHLHFVHPVPTPANAVDDAADVALDHHGCSQRPRPSYRVRLLLSARGQHKETDIESYSPNRVFLAEERDEAFKVDRSAKEAVTVVDADFRWEAPPPEDLKGPKTKKQQKMIAADKKGQAKRAKKEAKAAKKANALELKLDENAPIDAQTAEASGDATGDVSGPVSTEPATTAGTPAEQEKELMQLRGINLRVPKGQLCAIVGAVGSGKSSLLQALVGEMKRTKGELAFGGS